MPAEYALMRYAGSAFSARCFANTGASDDRWVLAGVFSVVLIE